MITADARLREELALCREYRIRHGEFLGWPADDQDKALAYERYDRSVCGGCGTRRDEWDPAAGGDRNAYVAATDTCPGCQVRGDLEHDLRERDMAMSGQFVALLPRAEAERRADEQAQIRARRAGLVSA